MRLISCNNCGVLLDHDKLKFADDIEDEYGGIDLSRAGYDSDRKDYFAVVACPVCKKQVFKESK